MFPDVLTAGHGPPGCRQTTTMAEENVSCCTSTRPLSTDHLQCLRYQVQTLVLVGPLGSRPEIATPQTATINTPKVDPPYRPLRLTRTAFKTNDPRLMTTPIMDREISSKSPKRTSVITSPSPQSLVRSNQIASTQSRKTRTGSRHPIHFITTSTLEDLPVKQSRRTSWPIVTPDTASHPRSTISRCQDPFPRDMVTQIPDCYHPELETSTPTVVSWPLLRGTHFLQISSHRPHPQLQQTTASYHHRHSLHVPARSTPRLRVCLVILLLIGKHFLISTIKYFSSKLILNQQIFSYLQGSVLRFSEPQGSVWNGSSITCTSRKG